MREMKYNIPWFVIALALLTGTAAAQTAPGQDTAAMLIGTWVSSPNVKPAVKLKIVRIIGNNAQSPMAKDPRVAATMARANGFGFEGEIDCDIWPSGKSKTDNSGRSGHNFISALIAPTQTGLAMISVDGTQGSPRKVVLFSGRLYQGRIYGELSIQNGDITVYPTDSIKGNTPLERLKEMEARADKAKALGAPPGCLQCTDVFTKQE